MLKRVCLVAVGLLMGACATPSNSTRLATDLKVSEFNSIASSYMSRPTSVQLDEMPDGREFLRIEVDQYGSTVAKYGTDIPNTLRLSKENIQGYLDAIDKYREWREIALDRQDQISREIADVETVNGKVRFEMHSGNEANHYLVLIFCAVGTCLTDSAMYLDSEAATELGKLLVKWQAGELNTFDQEQVYKR